MKAIVKKKQGESEASFSFVFVHDDGSALLQSARYKSKDSAYKGVRAIQHNCMSEIRYKFSQAPDGKYSFKIKSANGVAVADSVNFSSEQEMREIVSLIKTHVPSCEIAFEKTPY